MTDFDVQCVINGVDVTICDEFKIGYELDNTTRASRQEQMRKITVSSPFVEGEYDVQAVRGNVTETISIFIRGVDHEDLARKLLTVLDAVKSPSYPVSWRAGTLTEYWNCTWADFTVNAQQEFNFATMCQLVLTIPRRPKVYYSFGSSQTVVED